MAKKNTRQKTSSSNLFTAWLYSHHREFWRSLKLLNHTPIASFVTLMVLAIALSLPTGFYVLLSNAGQFTDKLENTGTLSVFLHHFVSEEAGESLSKKLNLRSDIKSTSYLSKNQVFEEFKENAGMVNVITDLKEHPLPALITIIPRNPDGRSLQVLKDHISALPEVNHVLVDLLWAKRLSLLISFAKRLVLAISTALALAVLLVVFNTIRLSLHHKQPEVTLCKLMGATDTYVRRPFLYLSLWYGLISACLAILLIEVLTIALNEPALALARSYQTEFKLEGLNHEDAFSLLVINLCVCFLGARLAVNRHLKHGEH